jgi:site-specific recombinase XerD
MERGKVGDEKTYRYASTVGLRGKRNIERLIISDESAKDALTTYKNGRIHKIP